MKVWFTSDTHFGHANIIKYCSRPFKDLTHMNRVLIDNWNARVKHEDMVIFLGDFCFRNSSGVRGEGTQHKAEYYMKQLNGMIVPLRGNHDNNNSLNTKIDSLIMNIGGQEIFCTHKPEDYNWDYKINLVGHVHEAWKIRKEEKSILVNVGVDVWQFHPININEILKEVQRCE